MTTPQLMAYVPGGIVTTMDTNAILPNWSNNQIYSMWTQATPSGGISQFTGYVSGDLSLAKTTAGMGISATGSWSGAAFCFTYNGMLVFPAGNGANSCQLLEVIAGNLSLFDTFGVVGSNANPSTNARLLTPGNIKPARWGKTDYVVCTSAALNLGEIDVLPIPAMTTNTNIGTLSETGVYACLSRGPIGTTNGVVYALGRGGTNGAMGLYAVSVPLMSLTRLGGISPAQIDSTWTHVTSARGMAYDETDGNVIIAVATTDSVTNTSYIVKLNVTNAAVMWTIPIVWTDDGMDAALGNASIKNGTLYLFGAYQSSPAGTFLWTINTIAGTASSTLISDMDIGGSQASEDTNNSVVIYGTWSEVNTHPTYIGTYMGTEGNHSYTGWMRYFITAPGPIPAPQPYSTGPPVVSVNRAWSYVLDGHTFYVLDLGAQGTFVYDIITQQWSNFATGALATNGGVQPQWNFQNGCMWGTRIMACDLSLPKLWEMTPASVLDNDTTSIGHLVTGGISSRSREYISCDAVRLAASFGQIESVTAINFNLRFSDDQEQTWSDYFTVVLTPDAFDDEIAWRSLGSFMAPGRIFELSDTGGLIRIDGCDAFLNGFDNDQESQNVSPNQK